MITYLLYDYNVQKMLEHFDHWNGTKLYERYMKNKINVEYDFVKCKENKVKRSIIKKLKVVTDRQKELKGFIDSEIKEPKKNRFKLVAATIGIAAMTFIGSVIGFGMKKSSSYDTTAKQSISTVNEVDDAGVTDAMDEYYEVKDTTESTTEAITCEVEVNDIESVSEEAVETPVEEEKLDIVETKIGDIVQFSDDIDLYYASTDADPRGNTSYLESNNYKVGLISIVKDGDVLDLIDNSDCSLEQIKEDAIKEYGNDVIVSVNYDLVDNNGDTITQYLGWSDGEEIGKVLVK